MVKQSLDLSFIVTSTPLLFTTTDNMPQHVVTAVPGDRGVSSYDQPEEVITMEQYRASMRLVRLQIAVPISGEYNTASAQAIVSFSVLLTLQYSCPSAPCSCAVWSSILESVRLAGLACAYTSYRQNQRLAPYSAHSQQ